MKQPSYVVELSESELRGVKSAFFCMDPSLFRFPFFERLASLPNPDDKLNSWREVCVLPRIPFWVESQETVPVVRLGELLEDAVGALSVQELGGLMMWLAGRISEKGKEVCNG